MTNGGEIIKKIASAFISVRLCGEQFPPPAAGWMRVMNGLLCRRPFWQQGDDGGSEPPAASI